MNTKFEINEDIFNQLDSVLTDLYEKLIIHREDVDMISELDNIHTIVSVLATDTREKYDRCGIPSDSGFA